MYTLYAFNSFIHVMTPQDMVPGRRYDIDVDLETAYNAIDLLGDNGPVRVQLNSSIEWLDGEYIEITKGMVLMN